MPINRVIKSPLTTINIKFYYSSKKKKIKLPQNFRRNKKLFDFYTKTVHVKRRLWRRWMRRRLNKWQQTKQVINRFFLLLLSFTRSSSYNNSNKKIISDQIISSWICLGEKESERLIAIWMCGNLNGLSFAFEINHRRHAKSLSFSLF